MSSNKNKATSASSKSDARNLPVASVVPSDGAPSKALVAVVEYIGSNLKKAYPLELTQSMRARIKDVVKSQEDSILARVLDISKTYAEPFRCFVPPDPEMDDMCMTLYKEEPSVRKSLDRIALSEFSNVNETRLADEIYNLLKDPYRDISDRIAKDLLEDLVKGVEYAK